MFNKLYVKFKEFILNNYKFLICLFVLFMICTYEFSYVIYTPGGIVKLSKRITLDDENLLNGEIAMSYVSMVKGTIPTLLLSYVIPNWDIVKKNELTDSSLEELIRLEKLYMTSSIDNATMSAFKMAQKKIDVAEKYHHIVYIDEKAKTNLEVFEQVLEVNDQVIENIDDLKRIVNEHNVGDELEILVSKDGKKVLKKASVYEIDNELKIGVAFLDTYDFESDPTVEVKTKSSESGSSGGFMMALAIYDSLIEEDLTKDLLIVGTGTIDQEGNIGEINGVKYKILGAVKNKADYFFCPIANYKEALKIKEEQNLDLEIKPFATLEEAVEFLRKI